MVGPNLTFKTGFNAWKSGGKNTLEDGEDGNNGKYARYGSALGAVFWRARSGLIVSGWLFSADEGFCQAAFDYHH